MNTLTSIKNKQKTLLIMAGGTGGHIFPGLAVAKKLSQQGWHIHWLGTKDRMEATIVPEHGYDISFIKISGLRHKGLFSWLKMPIKLLKSLWQARAIIKKVNPDIVLGMGGYASAPGGLAAWLMNTPLVVHEQNAAAGLSNRLLARIADKVCCAFPNAFAGKISNKIAVEVVGNPLRANIGKQYQANDTETKVTSKNILVVGGSLGAQVLNEVVPSCYAQLNRHIHNKNSKANKDVDGKNNEKNFIIWHQTGQDKQEKVIAEYGEEKIESGQVRVSEFINDIASAYQWADIVICRAGALTVSELAMAAKPAIFVPLPHAVDDHQTKNAQYLVSRGAAKLIPQPLFTTQYLTELVAEIFSEKQTLMNMSKAAFAAADKDATSKVANICQQLFAMNARSELST
ncbi:MAG: undecaprenyldiphospho-muramoylpentapeptide beta-N-acetylglucosaminyltransferase [Colwellia sp.]